MTPRPPSAAPPSVPPPSAHRSRRELGLAVSALAVGTRRSSTSGVVRLVLLPDRLVLELVRVVVHAPGFAFPPLVGPVTVDVPYAAVRSVVRSGAVLHLGLDPRVAAPHHQLALTAFGTGEPGRLLRLARLRSWATVGAVLVGALAATAAGGALAPRVAPWLTLVLAPLAALAGFVASRALAHAALFGLGSGRLAERVEEELAGRLGLKTSLPTAPWLAAASREEAPSPAPVRLALGTSFALALAGVGWIALARTGGGRQVLGDPERPAPTWAQAGWGGPLARAGARALEEAREGDPPPPDRVALGAACACPAPKIEPFPSGVPVLAVLVAADDADASERVEPRGRRGYRFDLVVLNDSAATLREPKVVVTFARRDRRGRRVGATDRGFYYPGELGPGRLVKWTVEGPGTELKIEASAEGVRHPKGALATLEEAGLAPAPADALAELARSRYAVVRKHAGKLLARAGDPRGPKLLAGLLAGGVKLDGALAELAGGAGGLRTCALAPREGGFSVCVQNDADVASGGVVLEELEGERRRFEAKGLVPATGGKLVEVAFGAGRKAKALAGGVRPVR